MSAFKAVKSAATDSFFQAFLADAKVHADTYAVAAFGDSAAMADELLALVLAGVKRATASLVRDYRPDTEMMPKVGDFVVLVDGRNKPRCVWRTTDIRIGPLASVDDAFAEAEGEGDGTREGWLADHRAYFTRQAARENFDFDDDIEVVFERFTVVWPRLFSDDWDGPPRLM